MYRHPAILEACVIGAKDAHRGETVKAVDRAADPSGADRVDASRQIIDWCHGNMAAYKCPRIVEFVEALPKSGAGKIMWRELQDREAASAKQLERCVVRVRCLANGFCQAPGFCLH